MDQSNQLCEKELCSLTDHNQLFRKAPLCITNMKILLYSYLAAYARLLRRSASAITANAARAIALYSMMGLLSPVGALVL